MYGVTVSGVVGVLVCRVVVVVVAFIVPPACQGTVLTFEEHFCTENGKKKSEKIKLLFHFHFFTHALELELGVKKGKRSNP